MQNKNKKKSTSKLLELYTSKNLVLLGKAEIVFTMVIKKKSGNQWDRQKESGIGEGTVRGNKGHEKVWSSGETKVQKENR